MYVLRQYVDRLRQLGVKLQLVGVAHDRPRFPNPVHGVEHHVLIGASVDADKYPVAPSGSFASDAALLRSAFVPDLFATERQLRTMLSASDSVVKQSCRLGR